MGSTAASEADCAERAGAGASVTPTMGTATPQSGTPARTAFVAGQAESTMDPTARAFTLQPDPDGVNTPDFWRALP
jgi:hypothetical protein